MDILYINPARLSSGLDAVIKGAPLSLISIAGMLSRDHGAKLFDFKVDKFVEKRFRRKLNRFDVVAITSMTPQIEHALMVATMAKEHGCTTILGGYHPTLAPDHVASQLSVDYSVRGEGEHTFKELIDYLDGNKNDVDIKEIDGVSYKVNGKVVHNNERHLEPDMDKFGMPRRDLLEGKLYSYWGTTTRQLETSRGCPHKCKFCCITKMWKDPSERITYRSKSLKRIMREIYDVDWKNNFIFLCEDNFTIKVKRANNILDTIIRSGVPSKVHFACQSRVDTIFRNQWLVKKFREAGFRQIFLGIESVHQQSLDAMNKRGTTPAMVRTVVKMLQDEGISIFGGIIIGYPGETKTMVRQNIAFAKSLNLSCIQFTPITAFPGTEFYDEMKEKGMITSFNYKHYDLFHPMMGTEQLTNRDIFRLCAEAHAAYYLNAKWLKSQAKRYLNPFGKWTWMMNTLPRLIKQMIMGGIGMLHTQGITHYLVSDELNYFVEHPEIIDAIVEGKPSVSQEKTPTIESLPHISS